MAKRNKLERKILLEHIQYLQESIRREKEANEFDSIKHRELYNIHQKYQKDIHDALKAQGLIECVKDGVITIAKRNGTTDQSFAPIRRYI